METIHKNTEWSGASQLLDSGEYSDLTLNCEDAKFRVHKAIVCAKSTVLASACGHGLQSKEKNLLYVPDFQQRTVRQMLEFMYTGDYKISTESESLAQFNSGPRVDASQPAEILLEQIRVGAIADYYDLPELRKLANAKAKIILEEHWSCPRFLGILQEVFQKSKDSSLRKLAAEVATAHIEELLQDDQFTRMRIMDDFSFAIIMDLVAKSRYQEQRYADECEALRTKLYLAENRARPEWNVEEQYEDYA